MKLALLYTFWTGDDIDMLIKSIMHHKDHVDKIVVSYQRMSNTGNYQPFVNTNQKFSFGEHGIETIYFDPNLKLSTKENERNKHNELIEKAKHLNCTHFILAASDHFYSPEMIQKGKDIMNDGNHDLIVTRMRTFYKNPIWILAPIEDYYMPFIHKLTINTEIVKNVKYPVLVDPSVKVNTSKLIYIMDNEWLMDHYSMIRKDIKKKFANAASSVRWTKEQVETFISEYKNAKLGDEITYFQNRKLVLYENGIEF